MAGQSHTLWLMAMNCYQVVSSRPKRTLSSDKENKFEEANTLFAGCVLSALADCLCDVYMHIKDTNELWDALNAKFNVPDAASELYIMELYHDYKIVDNRLVVEQAHDIQCIVKELKLLKCTLPDKFVVGGIIAKLPPL